MSRKRGRQTLQNRHRPLLPGQLKRRFIRERQLRRVEFEASLSLLEPDNDYYEPWSSCDYFDEWGNREDLIRFEFNQELNRLLHPGSPLVASDLIASTSASIENGFAPFTPATDDDTGTQSVLDRLRSLLQRGQPIDKLQASLEHTLALLARPETEAAVVRCQSRFSRSSLTKNLCYFVQFWIRHPAAWLRGNETSLVDHVLVRSKPPEFLYQVWTAAEPDAKWLCWFILLSQGEDLRAAAALMKWNLNRSMIPFLYEVPSDLSPSQACLFAEVRRLGGTERDARRLIANPGFQLDPTDESIGRAWLKFWYDVTRWMIQQSELITDEQSELILSWAAHEWGEAERLDRRFRMKGRRLRQTLERAHEYRQANLREWIQYQWEPHGWDWELDDTVMGQWTFIELTSGTELFEEGEAMHHCVARYASDCAEGTSVIVSVRRAGQRTLTVEIDPSTRRLIQARGSCNRHPTSKERAVIHRWMANVVRDVNSSQPCPHQTSMTQNV